MLFCEVQDSFGYSPLHIAALNEYSYCASLLLSYGADVTIRTNGGTSALSMIVRELFSISELLFVFIVNELN